MQYACITPPLSEANIKDTVDNHRTGLSGRARIFITKIKSSLHCQLCYGESNNYSTFVVPALDTHLIFRLPLPLLAPLYVSVRLWQLGHSRVRFSSELFSAFPSICSISSGSVFVYGLISDHPHREHLLLYFSNKYLLMCEDTSIHALPIVPVSTPDFHLSIYSS